MNVFSLPIIEIAVSIVICWGLFSIFCSMIQETIVQIKSERGRFMKKYILRQLYDEPNGINWGSLMYTNSNIELLSRQYNKPPSEITPKIFSETLIEAVANSHMVQSRKYDHSFIDKFPDNDPVIWQYNNRLLNDFSFATEVLMPSDVISFLKSALVKARIKAGPDEEKLYAALVEEISAWYGQLCEMTSIWYKKATKTRLFFLGLVLSIAFNIDSISLFKYFNDNPDARSGVINYYTTNEAYLEDLVAKYSDSAAVMPNEDAIAKLADIKTDLEKFRRETDSLTKATQLPIGWDFKSAKQESAGGHGNRNFLLMCLGFLISALAASMGAPFWFNLLKKSNPVKQ